MLNLTIDDQSVKNQWSSVERDEILILRNWAGDEVILDRAHDADAEARIQRLRASGYEVFDAS